MARVNKNSIVEDDYVNRALRVHPNPVNTNTSMEIGGMVLVDMIREELTHQLAVQKAHEEVPDEDVRTLAEYQKRVSPDILNQINNGQITEEDLERQIRYSIQQLEIGSEGAKPDENAIKAKYDQLTKAAPGQKPRLVFPEVWTIRVLPFQDKAQAQQALTTIQGGRPFQAVAQAITQSQPLAAQGAGRDTAVLAAQLQTQAPPLYRALAPLNSGQTVTEPISIQVPDPQTRLPRTFYLIAQMVRKEPETVPTLPQVRPLLQQIVISETRPEWVRHANQELAAYTRDSHIQIYIDRYKSLVENYVLAQAQSHAVPAPGGPVAVAPEGASPAGAAAPAPGAGGIAPAPAGGAGTAPVPAGP